MNDPSLYAKSNPFQIRDAQMALKTYGASASDITETDSVLDIGCGVGNVTKNVLSPALQSHRRIVGVDISKDMVDYARNNNTHDKIFYEVLDIGGDIQNFKNSWGQFSRIFSFYCLHWVKDHKKALGNIRNLLSTGGECLLVFVAQCAVFELYKIMSKSPRWQRYMMDVDDFIPSTQYSYQPAYDFTKLMEACELDVLNCDAPHMEFTFPSVDILKDCVSAVNPFLCRIPDEEKQDYITECLKILSSAATHDADDNGNVGSGFSYKLIVARARRAL